MNTDRILRPSPPWPLLDETRGWAIHGRCVPAIAVGDLPRKRSGLFVNDDDATIIVTPPRPPLEQWSLSATWRTKVGLREQHHMVLDPDSKCRQCERSIVEVGVAPDGTVMIGHQNLLF